jgi:glycosyltransferase involved in cell wall biosynthesis
MLSIVIPTTRNLNKLIESLSKQTYKDYELIIREDKGLVKARNEGWKQAKGEIVAFIDDDVILEPYWASQIVKSFKSNDGVFGGVITHAEKRDNDWKNPIMRNFFRSIGSPHVCNMAFTKKFLEKVGGFDPIFERGVGEWSEPDLSLKAKMVRNNFALLHHHPSPDGIYKNRSRVSYQRMRNFLTFRKRWLKMDINLVLVTFIFYTYWIYKFLKTGDFYWLGGLRAIRGYE